MTQEKKKLRLIDKVKVYEELSEMQRQLEGIWGRLRESEYSNDYLEVTDAMCHLVAAMVKLSERRDKLKVKS